ncbi:uridine kinase family protein [Actinophytocola sp.]|uniref:uridine kinase family protein n=1 Tax=Actinophytocola sp. TaxID=1872138 RepID=UPI002ED85ED3
MRFELGPPRLGRVRLVAIDGPSGSGKSTLADTIAVELHATVVRTDDFATWDDPVAWWPRLLHGVLEPLADGRPGGYVRTEWTGGHPHPGATVTITPSEVLLLEGVSAGRRSIRPRLSALIWCEVADRAERLARAVARDGEALREPLTAWQEFEDGWFAVDGTKAAAGYRA